ncbi:MAG: tyrosine-type recombinase/integrase, partial [Clostridia bacterium]
ALIDYGLHGRPASDSPVVFLRSMAPHRPLAEDSAVYSVVAAAMARAGIRQAPGDRRGPHALRHSLASRLLAVETPLPVIASVLGHGNKETTTIYLSTDTDHLRACALDLGGIPVTREELRA